MHENKLSLIILFFYIINISCEEKPPVLLTKGLASQFYDRTARYSHKLVQPVFQRCGLGQADQDSWGEYIKGGKKFSDVMDQIDRQAQQASASANFGNRLKSQIDVYNKAACVYVDLSYKKDDAQFITEEEALVKESIAKKIAPELYHLGCQIKTAQTKAELADRLEAAVLSDVHNMLFKEHESATKEISQVDRFLRCIETASRLEKQNLSANNIAHCFNDARKDWVFDRAVSLAHDLEKTGERVALNDCNSLIDLLKLLEKKQLGAGQIAINPVPIVKAGITAESSYPDVIKYKYSQRAAFYRCAIDHINKQVSSSQLGDECLGWLTKEDREGWFGCIMSKHLQDTYERVTKIDQKEEQKN